MNIKDLCKDTLLNSDPNVDYEKLAQKFAQYIINHDFSLSIAALIDESHANAVEKGWWEGNNHNFPEKIALMHSELSEALEEYRKVGMTREAMIHQVDEFGFMVPCQIGGGKPEGIAVELADLVIRLGDICGFWNIPLEEAVRLKMAYNKTRSHRHGGKLA